MSNYNELKALREYAQTLEKENEAKTIEQMTLYRQLESLETELQKMEKYYHQSREMNQEILSLKSVISSQQQYLEEAEQRLQDFETICQDNNQLEQRLNAYSKQISQLETLTQDQNFKIQRLEHELAALNHENNLAQRKYNQIQGILEEKQEENQTLKQRIDYLSNEQNQQVQKNLHDLAENYEKIELVVLQKDQTIQEMETYISQLEYQCQYLNQELIRSQNQTRKLEYELKSIQMRRNSRERPDDNLSFLTDSISKVDLIRQSNRMLERIVRYEKENNGNDNLSHRHSYSECGDGSNSNSPSKLQMRIKTLKMENQNLLKTLAI